jgi:type IV secretion system protein VirD4
MCEALMVRFILDEAGSLKRMEALEDLVDKLRSYGVRGTFIYQDLGQLKKCWQEGAEITLLANTSQTFFGCNDPTTCEYVSNRLGQKTIVVKSGGQNKGQSTQDGTMNRTYSGSGNDNWAFQGRKLLQMDEVARLDQRIAITFHPGCPPIMTRLHRYYETKPWRIPSGLRVLLLSSMLFGLTVFCWYSVVTAVLNARPSAVRIAR